jgi:hypothetical protein
MIDQALEIKPLLANLKSNLKTLTDNWPTDEEWEILTELANLLAPFASITKVIYLGCMVVKHVNIFLEWHGNICQILHMQI